MIVLLVLPLLLLAAPATSLAQEPASEASEAVPPARAGLERRQTLPPPPPIPPVFSANGVLRGGAQWIVNPPRAKDDVFGFGAFDAILVWRPRRTSPCSRTSRPSSAPDPTRPWAPCRS